MSSIYIFCDGKLISLSQVSVSLLDHGFLYGVSCFESMRVTNKRVPLLDLHLARLENALTQLGIPNIYTSKKWSTHIAKFIESNALEDAVIRLTITAGESDSGQLVGEYKRPHTYMHSRPLLEQQDSKELKLSSRAHVPGPGFKCSYLNNILAAREIGLSPKVEGLMLTQEGFIAECITSNIFWVKQGILYTPSLELGIVEGVMRSVVLDLAAKLKLQIVQGSFLYSELAEADEIFITNAVHGIKFVSCFEEAIKDLDSYILANKLREELERVWGFR